MAKAASSPCHLCVQHMPREHHMPPLHAAHAQRTSHADGMMPYTYSVLLQSGCVCCVAAASAVAVPLQAMAHHRAGVHTAWWQEGEGRWWACVWQSQQECSSGAGSSSGCRNQRPAAAAVTSAYAGADHCMRVHPDKHAMPCRARCCLFKWSCFSDAIFRSPIGKMHLNTYGCAHFLR